jgi:uncharacterized membrane protein
MSRSARSQLFWVALISSAAFALRVAELTGRSIWLDEGTTLLRLSGSLAENLANVIYVAGERTIDTQPPVYFLLLRGFVALGGEHEFIFRFFSVTFGVLCVPLTFALSRRMFGVPTALIAAALIALSPGLIWYSREIRMYSLVPFLALAMTYAAYVASQTTQRIASAWCAWIAAAATSLLTHYSFAGLIIGQGAFLLAWTARRWGQFRLHDRRILLAASASSVGAAILALLTPFVREILARLSGGQDMNYAFVPIEIVVQTQFGGLLLGLNAFDFSAGAIGIIAGALCLLTAIGPLFTHFSGRARAAHVLLAASVITPVAMWFALSFIKPNYQGFRHLILVTPAAAILLARFCTWLASGLGARPSSLGWRALGAAVCASIVGVQGYGIVATFTRTPNWQDDWRALAYYVRDHWQPGDVLIIGGLPTVAAPITPYLRGVTWFQEDGAGSPDRLPPDMRRVWYVDRGRGRPRQLNDGSFLRRQVDFSARSTAITLRLLESEAPFSRDLPDGARPIESASTAAEAGAAPRLVGYAIAPGAPLNPQPNLTLMLYWQRQDAYAAPPANAEVAVRLRYGDEVWLNTNVPSGLDAAGDAWQAGDYFRTEHIILIPPGLPALPYQLEFSVLMGEKRERIQHALAPALPEEVACCIRVTHWPAREEPMTAAAAAAPQPTLRPEVARLRFPPPPALGDVLIHTTEYPAVLRPGELLPVVLTWQPTRSNLAPWQTALKLEGLFGGDVAAARRDAGTRDFPVPAWPLGEPVRDQYVMQLPFAVQPGWYRLSLERWRDGRRVDGALLGLLRIEDYPRTPVADRIHHAVNAQVGPLRLLGYSVNGPLERGRTCEFVTHWQVKRTPDRDGVLFLHLIGPDGQLVSQDDNPPIVNGAVRSTLTYRAGDGIDQVHRLALPGDLPAGEYRLHAGIYDREGGLRWPAQQDDRPARDDLVLLGMLTFD